MRLLDIYTWELAKFQNQLIHRFMLAADVVGGGIREFMNNADGPALFSTRGRVMGDKTIAP